MGTPQIQTSFASGELSPTLYGRVDLAKYHTGLALSRNEFVDYRGGVSNRAGTQYVGVMLDQDIGRLIPFQYNTDQTYVLQFGNNYMRVVHDGGMVTLPPTAITAVSNTTFYVAGGHGLNVGDQVLIVGTGGLADAIYNVSQVTSTVNFFVTTVVYTPVNITNLTPGTYAKVYTLATPYTSADIGLLKYAQSKDVITLTHPNYPPYDLTRYDHDNWVLTLTAFTPPMNAAPSGLSATATPAPSGSPSSTFYSYVVTATNQDGAESIASGRVDIQNAVNFTATAGSVTLNWNPVYGSQYYTVYRAVPAQQNVIPQGATYGYVGSTTTCSFNDTNIIADFTRTPPIHSNPFAASAIQSVTVTAQGSGIDPLAGIVINDVSGFGATLIPIIRNGSILDVNVVDGGQNFLSPSITLNSGTGYQMSAVLAPATGTYPSVVSYFQQRKVYAATNADPDRFWMSQPGEFTNFDVSNPVRDSDSISGRLFSNQVNNIKALVPMPSGLIALTSGGAWQISGGTANAAVTPKSITATPQSYSGVSDLQPIVVNYDIVYVQALGSVVRDLSYNFYANVYTGVDVSVLSNHFFFNHTLVSWTYCDEPYRLFWCCRDDGAALAFTYLKEQDVYGWTQCNTPSGNFMDVTSIAEDGENIAYFIVQRVVNGTTFRFIEKMVSRKFDSLVDAWFVDCGASYAGAPTTTLQGLDHLEGYTVAVVGDGLVQSSKVVTQGKITLDTAASNVIVGLGYTSQGQTLRAEVQGGSGTSQTKRKKINAITLRIDRARGLQTGVDFNNLVPLDESMLPANQLFSNDVRMNVSGGWDTYGQMCWQQTSPQPYTVLAAIPEMSQGDTDR